VGDNWLPPGDTDWADYFHDEYQGFNQVYITSPANDLTVDSYYSTEGWKTPGSDYQNFEGASLYEEDVYSGNSPTTTALLSTTTYTYANNSNACRSTSQTYPACETVLVSSKTTQYERTGSSSAPWVQNAYTYDDYNNGLQSGHVYHNLTQEIVTSSNAPTLTKKWSYTTNDQVVGQWTYYTVDKVTHSEIDDNTGHVWQCQDTTYDEGAPSGTQTPSAGWATTVKTYTTCGNSGTAITNYMSYDAYGNLVAAVDGVASANSGLYTTNGCTLSTSPAILSYGWGKTSYTDCTTYDSAYNTLPITQTNALGQQSSIGYDNTQGKLPTSTTDINGQVTNTSYSYDSSGNQTVQVKKPLEGNGYTTQSKTNTSCAWNSTLPCFEIDTNASQYSGAIARTFYDSLGREVETRTPGPISGDDTIVMTVYNDQAHTVWQSVPFEVASGTSWLDPNGAKDINNVAPGGTVTFYDALNRPLAVQDPLYGTGTDQISCSQVLSGTYTACTNYILSSPHGSSTIYTTTQVVDPNKHVMASYSDALGRTLYVEEDRGQYGGSLTVNEQKSIQYTVLNESTSVTTTDLAPQSGQSITSVTTSAQYDDMGRMTQLVDPDAGTHVYTYDPDGHMLSDVVGAHTLGYNDDLLERVGCIQDGIPTINATGACTNGTHPYVQNTYDTTFIGQQGSTDFPKGHLTQSIATTYYPEGTSATATEQMQYDKRGRQITEYLSFSLPGSWGVSSPLPTYQLATSYNDADQVTTTTTSTNPAGQGYTTTQVYDANMGALTGLSNNGNNTANLATIGYNARAGIDTIYFKTSTGSSLATEQFGYDANLRTTSTTTTWQGGSGQSGTILSQGVSYDAASNVISLSTTQASVPGYSNSGGSETENFCYDEQNRLVWAGNSGTQPSPGNGTCGSGTLGNSLNGTGYSSNYVYTHLGQLWQGPLSGGSTQYQYLYCNSNAPHQLTGLYSLGATCSNKGTASYSSSYDAWGNVTSRYFSGTTGTLSYDNLNHFVEWNVSSTNQEWYVYDAAGNRVLRRSTNGSSTSLIVYAFGLEEHNYSSSGTNQWNIYYYSLGGRLIGEMNANNTYFLLTDALGSILSSISWSAGGASVQGNQVFGPYGKARDYQGNISTAKGYTGQYNDGLTGLDYYNARYYDPVVGVFLSADKVQGNVQGMNPYGYVGGNPETRNDPTGHDGDPGGIMQVFQNPWFWAATAVMVSLAGAAAWFLIGGSIALMQAPPQAQESGSSPNSPHPAAAPTPTDSPTPEATPSTDTSGAGATTRSGCGNGSLTILPHLDEGTYSADELAAAYYVAGIYSGTDDKVILRPATGKGKTSDLVVNGKTYDIYTPKTNDVGSIVSTILRKNSQTTGIVLNLSRTSVTRSDLGNLMYRVIRAAEVQGVTLNIDDVIVMDGYHDENDHYYNDRC